MKNVMLSLSLLMWFGAQSQVGIGIPNPDRSAILELSSKEQGFLPPRLTPAERDAIIQPAVGLMIFNTTKNCLEIYYGSGWYSICSTNAIVDSYICNTGETGLMTVHKPVAGVTQTITAQVLVVGNYTISATANGITFSASGTFDVIGLHAIILTATGTPNNPGIHDFVITGTPGCSFTRQTISTVTGAAGKVWMAYNVGATTPATSMTDDQQYGGYFQWGREADGHEIKGSAITRASSDTDNPGHGFFITNDVDWRSTPNSDLWQGVDGVNNPCFSGFRVPTSAEWDEEIASANITDLATAFRSVLQIPASGIRLTDGNYDAETFEANYWTSSASFRYSYSFVFSTTRASLGYFTRGEGLSVRCIKD